MVAGHTEPPGATWDGQGVKFSLFSRHAQAVELCLFDAPSPAPHTATVPLTQDADHFWYVYLPNARPGQLYGYRVHGPYDPSEGHRFNANKLLLDPLARAITGDVTWHDAVYGYTYGNESEDLSLDGRDSAAYMPRCVVIDPAFDWQGDRPPRTPWSDTLIYECHVKGLTKLHPEVAPELRGTYLGLCSPPVIDHLDQLGVTAVELLPVHHCLHRRSLVERGLVNYWGYDPVGFIAPDARFATDDRGAAVREFQTMVRTLHRAGIEVILDVVFNHTVEGDRFGPTLSLRGIDNRTYYRLLEGNLREYENFTGCGNTLNVAHPRVLQLVIDSLRYWVQVMHVDGFRFDLATVLVRGTHGVDPFPAFLDALRNDPILADVKLIAEPWDLGPDGYRLGSYPPPWAEWNDRFRDGVRQFWRGDMGQTAQLASRITGSSDIFAPTGRPPTAGINFITAHDGFTLHDLVTFERKHNEANGENNHDGVDHNFSRHWGIEGPTDRWDVNRQRDRVRRSLMSTLLLSLGVPMLTAGDEIGHSQQGNNNPYCQDNPLTWIDWKLDIRQVRFLNFTRGLTAARRCLRAVFSHGYFHGVVAEGVTMKDLTWLREDGGELTHDDWRDPHRHTLAAMMHRTDDASLDSSTFLLLVNAHPRRQEFRLPTVTGDTGWRCLVNTARTRPGRRIVYKDRLRVAPLALVLLQAEVRWRNSSAE